MPDSRVVFFLVSFLTKVGTPTDFIEKPEEFLERTGTKQQEIA